MYKTFTANDYKKFLALPDDYIVDGIICYGTSFFNRTLSDLTGVLDYIGKQYELNKISHPVFDSLRELKIDNKVIWFAVGYGGSALSEYVHLACLLGSKKTIFLGSAGGLYPQIKSGDFIIPTYSFGLESSVTMYNRLSDKQIPDEALSNELSQSLVSEGHSVWRGPIVTCQAILAETMSDVEKWSSDGYYGVEMESATVIAVSNHFNVPVSGIIYISDNLINDQTSLDEEYKNESHIREQKRLKQLEIAIHAIAR